MAWMYAAAGLLVLLWPPATAAQWRPGGEPVCTAPGSQVYPFVLADGRGGAFIAWPDGRDSASLGSDIYAQRLDASGVEQWTSNGVPVCAFTGDQINVQTASDGADGVIMAWQDLRSGSHFDIYAQRLGPSGNPLWTPGGVRLRNSNLDQWLNVPKQPAITGDGAGGAIVAWEQYVTGYNTDIRAQRVDSTGTVQWSQYGVPICTATSFQEYPTVVGDGAGGAVITWTDWRFWPVAHAYAQRVNGAGQPQWAPSGIMVSDSTGDQRERTVIPDGAGGAIIAYTEWVASGNADIYAQLIDVSGLAQWTPGGVPVCTVAANQLDPVITSDGAGGAIVAWDDNRTDKNGFSTDIYAQHLDAGGSPTWIPQGVGVCTSSGVQLDVAVVADGSGGAIVAWTNESSASNVYAQHLDALGMPRWMLNGVTVAASPYAQSGPVLTPDAADGAIIAWADARNGACDRDCTNVDIFASRLLGAGSVGVSVEIPAVHHSLTVRPNPMRGMATVRFDLARPERVTVEVFDLVGQRVRTLAAAHDYPPGTYALLWDGRNDAGLRLASGLYLVRASSGGHSESRRVVLMH